MCSYSFLNRFCSDQSLGHAWLWYHGPQHARPPCPWPAPELAQTHVHWVGDSIQPSYPQLSAFPPALNFSQHQDLFTSESYRGWVLFEDTTCVHAQSCPVLCDPMVFSPPCFSVHEILLERILEWVIISSSRGCSWPRDQTCISCVFCITGGFFFVDQGSPWPSTPIHIKIHLRTLPPWLSIVVVSVHSLNY